MKKLLLIITLFVSSFFLFCRNEVKASEVILDITFDLIDDTFLNVKNLADEFLTTNTDYDTYIIVYKSGYKVYFFKNASASKVSCNVYSGDLSCPLYKSYTAYSYYSSSSTLGGASTSSSFGTFDYASKFSNILYSTIPFIQSGGYSTDIINLNYQGNTKMVLYEETVPLVYDLYLEINSSEEEVPEELENVTNFYLMVIEKINYLAEQIATNYVLLSIIGIFIIVFLFLLIFRRFLC